MMRKVALLILLLCPLAYTAATPNITVSGNSVTILGLAQTISLTCTLIDPNNTGNLHSGANIITVFVTNTTTPGNVATCGPIYGNDVITDAFGNANTTYYKVQVFTVSGGIVASTPSLQAFYAFTGSGTVDLSTATPLAPSFMSGANGSVVMPGTLTVTGATTLNNPLTVSGTTTFNGDAITKNTPAVDVRAFGAKCDGVTNDTAAFQAAAVQVNGGQVLGSGGGSDSGAVVVTAARNASPSNPTVCLTNAIGLRDVTLVGSTRDSIVIKPFSAPTLPLTISSISRAANVVTVNTSSSILGGISNLFTNGTVVIAGVTGGATSFNGTFIIASTPSTTQFTYSQTGGNESGSGGTAGMAYLLDGHLERDGVTGTPIGVPARFAAHNLTIDCTNFPTWGGVRAWAGEQDFTDANLFIKNCVEGFTSSAPTASIFSNIHTFGGVQGIYFQNQQNGTLIPAIRVDNTWNDSATAYGFHIGATSNGVFNAIITQSTSGTTTTPNIPCANVLFEGNSNGASISNSNLITGSDNEASGSCVPFYMLKQRKLDFEPGVLISPSATTNFVELNDVTGIVRNIWSNTTPGGGKFFLNSTNNSSGIQGSILVQGSTVTVNSNNDFQFQASIVSGSAVTMIPAITLGQGLGSGFPILARGFNTLIVQDGTGGASSGIQTGNNGITPTTAGTGDLGTTALPFGNLWLGTAATNNFKFQPAATAAARVISIPDPLGATSLPLTIANGTKALNTASITTATCDAGVAASATGTLSTDTVDWSFNAAPTATNKYGAFLVVYAVPSANTVTFYTCNPSATTSTPTAMTVNWSVRRP